MSDAPWQLQTAIYAALSGNVTLAGLADIYNHPPKGAALPFIGVRVDETYDWSTKTFDGGRHQINIDVWSNYRGDKEASDIEAQIRATLHNANLTVTGHNLVLIQYDYTRRMTDIDGETIHYILEFRALTEDI